ncbi:hypothetical protein MKW98_001188 [Papaver atlanticum]|uniref:Uncharacterized protein n=1 Tax=Papaver atlanticum TaxID=357466 RepID=A0AAD4XIA4_9MAGN|nr:hypothetical protein MKW98_001188 [Papaver atlanticum]
MNSMTFLTPLVMVLHNRRIKFVTHNLFPLSNFNRCNKSSNNHYQTHHVTTSAKVRISPLASCGAPSWHSALCTALTTSVALCHGYYAGVQAHVLNVIIEDLFQGYHIIQRKLNELLGHTPSQVLAGAVLGILVALFCCQCCLTYT